MSYRLFRTKYRIAVFTLKPLSFNELLNINNNEINNFETFIELESIFDFVKLAVSKKIEKM
ncbi:MAG: hypothetical protein ABF633_10145 [Clostridium sp.]|uniref:hypothetical protein n=1 Tax=Clostridium sp. TaxID=1506 RepID=UPI0039E73E9E